MSGVLAALYGLNFLSGVFSNKAAENAQIEANKKTARGYLQQMNYSFQNMEIQRQSLFASAIDDLTKTRMQANKQVSSVLASVGEDNPGGGRTADALVRSVKGMKSRALDSIVANYKIKSNEIDLNKEATLISTKNAIDSIPAVTRKSWGSYLMDAANTYIAAKGALSSREDNKEATKSGTEVIHNENKSYSYNRNVQGVDLDKYMETNTNQYSFFSTNSLFSINPVASYYSGVGYNGAYNYSGGLNSQGGGNRRWQTKLLLQ